MRIEYCLDHEQAHLAVGVCGILKMEKPRNEDTRCQAHQRQANYAHNEGGEPETEVRSVTVQTMRTRYHPVYQIIIYLLC